MGWLLLLHQIPPKPPYFRAKVLRRLGQVGALPVKNSAYLLPDTEDTREDFEWIRREIAGEGGAAWLFRAEAVAGLSDEQIRESFRRLLDADYEALLRETDEARLAERLEEVKRVDFFEHPARVKVEALLQALKTRSQEGATAKGPTGRTWVTRRGIRVDRIGSAWLIRRFIDPRAVFRFVEPGSYEHAAGEQRFDMYEGEYTHEGDQCTFEVLVARHRLLAAHPGLQALAEMVHDIDLKDGRYQRGETSGLSRMLEGLCARTDDDEVRLERGGQIFDAMYESFAG